MSYVVIFIVGCLLGFLGYPLWSWELWALLLLMVVYGEFRARE